MGVFFSSLYWGGRKDSNGRETKKKKTGRVERTLKGGRTTKKDKVGLITTTLRQIAFLN